MTFSSDFLLHLYREALAAVDPSPLVHKALSCKNNLLKIADRQYDLDKWDAFHVLAFGKASLAMASAVHALLGSRIAGGIVVAPEGSTAEAPALGKLELVYGSHPIPSENSVAAGKKLYQYATELSEKDFVIVLISGGGSALVEYPRTTLSELQSLTKKLLASGARIQDINALRSAFSHIKGGGLASALYPAHAESLILSDVIGNDIASIASGATYTGKNSMAPADVLRKYGISSKIPDASTRDAKGVLKVGGALNAAKTVVHNTIIGSIESATTRIASILSAKRIPYLHLSDALTGEAATLGDVFAALCEQIARKRTPLRPPCVVFAGGESTVTLTGTGKGGRNQELCLSFLASVVRRGCSSAPFYFLSAASDGIDGPTDAAGAWCTPSIFNYAECARCEDYLANNDAYHFFQKTEGLLRTGHSGTNVCDIQIACIGG